MAIGEICKKDVKTIGENASLKEAAKLMAEGNLGFLIVVNDDGNNLVGTVTDRDIVIKGIAENQDLNTAKVCDIMCNDVSSIDASKGINDIIELMSEKKVRRLPIVSDNKICGVISLDDLLPILAKELNTLAEIPRQQST